MRLQSKAELEAYAHAVREYEASQDDPDVELAEPAPPAIYVAVEHDGPAVLVETSRSGEIAVMDGTLVLTAEGASVAELAVHPDDLVHWQEV